VAGTDLDPVVDAEQPRLDTAPTAPARLPSLGPLGWARWAWRQLTSMRTALFLLFLLAAFAVPGSVFPQRRVDASRVSAYADAHPTLFPWLDRVGAFDVFTSVWFSATYLLLMISLVGCILPRSRQHWAAMRAKPPVAPRRLDRLPVARRWETDQSPSAVVEAAATVLRGARFRIRRDPEGAWVAAEKGHLRETGNLVFHTSLLLMLVAVGIGSMGGFTANIVVPEGGSFANAKSIYDTFRSGSRFSPASLEPFSLTVERFDVRYETEGEARGAPRDYNVHVRWRPDPAAPERDGVIRANHPLEVGGTKVFLTGNGYAPHFTVRDGSGKVVFSDSVTFLPRDANFSSEGVIKVPDAEPDQLGIAARFLPTAVIDPDRGPVSVFPDDRLPRVVLTAWRGDLGLDDGTPQSVYVLDTDPMKQLMAGGKPFTAALAPGGTATLPDGAGTVTFDRVNRFVNLQVAHDPGRYPALAAAVLAIAGLMASLFVRRRRVWVRAVSVADARTVVEVAGLSRTEYDGLADEVDELAGRIGGPVAQRTEDDR
jgi:cytochrome c biogenesis protein